MSNTETTNNETTEAIEPKKTTKKATAARKTTSKKPAAKKTITKRATKKRANVEQEVNQDTPLTVADNANEGVAALSPLTEQSVAAIPATTEQGVMQTDNAVNTTEKDNHEPHTEVAVAVTETAGESTSDATPVASTSAETSSQSTDTPQPQQSQPQPAEPEKHERQQNQPKKTPKFVPMKIRNIVDLAQAPMRSILLTDQQIQQASQEEIDTRHKYLEFVLADVLDYDIVISDTNIWIELNVEHKNGGNNGKVDAKLAFEHQLEFISKMTKLRGGRFMMMGDTYEEIDRFATMLDPTNHQDADWNDNQVCLNAAARLAKRLILLQQRDNRLRIEGIGAESHHAAFADPAIIRKVAELFSAGKKVLLLTNDASVAIRSMGICDDLQRHNGISDDEWDEKYAPRRPMVFTFDDLRLLDNYTRQYHYLQLAAGCPWMNDIEKRQRHEQEGTLNLWIDAFRPGDRHRMDGMSDDGNRQEQKQRNGNKQQEQKKASAAESPKNQQQQKKASASDSGKNQQRKQKNEQQNAVAEVKNNQQNADKKADQQKVAHQPQQSSERQRQSKPEPQQPATDHRQMKAEETKEHAQQPSQPVREDKAPGANQNTAVADQKPHQERQQNAAAQEPNTSDGATAMPASEPLSDGKSVTVETLSDDKRDEKPEESKPKSRSRRGGGRGRKKSSENSANGTQNAENA